MPNNKEKYRKYFLPEYDDFGREISLKKRLVKCLIYGIIGGCYGGFRSLIRYREYTIDEHIFYTLTFLAVGFAGGLAWFFSETFIPKI